MTDAHKDDPAVVSFRTLVGDAIIGQLVREDDVAVTLRWPMIFIWDPENGNFYLHDMIPESDQREVTILKRNSLTADLVIPMKNVRAIYNEKCKEMEAAVNALNQEPSDKSTESDSTVIPLRGKRKPH